MLEELVPSELDRHTRLDLFVVDVMIQEGLHRAHQSHKRLFPALNRFNAFADHFVRFGCQEQLVNLVVNDGREVRHVDGGLTHGRATNARAHGLNRRDDLPAEVHDLRQHGGNPVHLFRELGLAIVPDGLHVVTDAREVALAPEVLPRFR